MSGTNSSSPVEDASSSMSESTLSHCSGASSSSDLDHPCSTALKVRILGLM
eukprot:CAMPEP_0194062406 /NCGR_PEP_ID=MMETSP0009_2-20130614/77467_1 /TAXON_ID=210454 /ORGANISM="Grammatophora oceanica, Strain CCMP 410" /LENGTH=50 /DNA_ID=CAMNT_0038714143 /DNA_START=152 /DNA_END=304 /DNA_ORIENTATION=+